MELYLIRHGQSVNNAIFEAGGNRNSPDPELTEIGCQQATLLAEFLKEHQPLKENIRWNAQNRYGFGLTHIYTSLMVRAVATAYPVAEALELPLQGWVDLHEEGGIFWEEPEGVYTGLPGKSLSYFKKFFPRLLLPPDVTEEGWWNRPFESFEDRPLRARRVLKELLERHSDCSDRAEHRVAFFTHGGFSTHFLCATLDMNYRQATQAYQSWFLKQNASISHLSFKDNELILCYLNRVDFLPNELVT